MAHSARPNLAAHFRWEIASHVHGMMCTTRRPAQPRDVVRIAGNVTDRVIVVTMRDGTVWHWTGGRYAARKVLGCYAPLMPKPATAADVERCAQCGDVRAADRHTLDGGHAFEAQPATAGAAA